MRIDAKHTIVYSHYSAGIHVAKETHGMYERISTGNSKLLQKFRETEEMLKLGCTNYREHSGQKQMLCGVAMGKDL